MPSASRMSMAREAKSFMTIRSSAEQVRRWRPGAHSKRVDRSLARLSNGSAPREISSPMPLGEFNSKTWARIAKAKGSAMREE